MFTTVADFELLTCSVNILKFDTQSSCDPSSSFFPVNVSKPLERQHPVVSMAASISEIYIRNYETSNTLTSCSNSVLSCNSTLLMYLQCVSRKLL